jgi:hypothetical protein
VAKPVIVKYEDIYVLRVYHTPVSLRNRDCVDRFQKISDVERQSIGKDKVHTVFRDGANRARHERMIANVIAWALGVETDSIQFKCIRLD